MPKVPYENLHLIPSVIAETVCRREYKGEEDFGYSPAEISVRSTLACRVPTQKMVEGTTRN